MDKKPLTQRELRKQKKGSETIEYVTIINKSGKQTVPIQLRAPKGVDFFVGEQTVPLYPNKMAKFPKNRLYMEQIMNYEKSGRIRVIAPSAQ
jgi:hypothetical protein